MQCNVTTAICGYISNVVRLTYKHTRSFKNDPESNMVCSKNYEPYEVTPLLKNSDKHLSFLHLKIFFTFCPYWRTFNTWITERNLTFDFIRTTESRLTLHKNLISSIQLPGHNIEYTPTECSNEGTLLYTKKKDKIQT